MTVEGELDDISGSGQTRAAQDMCTGVPAKDRLHLEVPGAGHYGIFSGSRWRNVVYPQVVKFILDHAPKTAAKSAVQAVTKVAAVKPAVVKTAKAAAAPAKVAAAPAKVPAKTKTVVKTAAVKASTKAVAKSPAKTTAASKTATAVKTSWVQPKPKA
jgi:poly(3-hydroxybutyrate) depolymerase